MAVDVTIGVRYRYDTHIGDDHMSQTTTDRVTPDKLAIVGKKVRYLEPDGRVSTDIYEVIDATMQNKRVILTQVGTNRRVVVNERRLLPETCETTATVVNTSDNYAALCPKCGKHIPFTSMGRNVVEAECDEHGKFQLHWLGVKPMSIDKSNAGIKTPKTVKENKPKEPKPAKPEQPTTEKKPKVAKVAKPADMNAIAQLGDLYTKGGLPFDCPQVALEAHALLVGDRKHCFNTYNGSFGKKSTNSYDTFTDPEAGFAIKDQAKERADLIKNGYRLVKPT